MLAWFAETTLISTILASVALLVSRCPRLGPAARHVLWLMVLIRLLVPPLVCWPWATPLPWVWPEALRAPHTLVPEANAERSTQLQLANAEVFVPPPETYPLVEFLTTTDVDTLSRMTLLVWVAASVVLAVRQALQIVRFRRRFRWAVPAPGWMDDEARCIAQRLGLRSPEILVLPGQASPMVWFLGRPRLLVPRSLVEVLGRVAWRGVLAHELAHLLRRDHWVRRLVMTAGLIWWWNPLYWLTRRRLDAEAELACDEWAVAALPGGRFAYAEAILEVCRSLCSTDPTAPALSAVGSGAFLERRVTMILDEHKASRVSGWVLAVASLMFLVALPSWSAPASPVQHSMEPDALSLNSNRTLATTIGDDQVDAATGKRATELKRVRPDHEQPKQTLIEVRSILSDSLPQASVESPGRTVIAGLRYSDLDRLVASVPSIDKAIPVREIPGRIRNLEKVVDCRIVGTTHDFSGVNRIGMDRGRFIIAADDTKCRDYAVLGREIAKILFPTQDPVGQPVSIGPDTFIVVGVTGPRESDKNVYIPLNTSKARYGDLVVSARGGRSQMSQLSRIIVLAREGVKVEETAELINSTLKPFHPRGGVEVLIVKPGGGSK